MHHFRCGQKSNWRPTETLTFAFVSIVSCKVSNWSRACLFHNQSQKSIPMNMKNEMWPHRNEKKIVETQKKCEVDERSKSKTNKNATENITMKFVNILQSLELK